jgi:hypothetical protein
MGKDLASETINEIGFMTEIEKLYETLLKYSNIEETEVYTNKEGEKYKYIRTTLKYKNTPCWLRKMFFEAVFEVKGNYFEDKFSSNGISFSFQIAKYKGQKDGKIYTNKLIVLN